MPVSQFGGVHLEYPSLVSETPFRSVKDYENYIARLHQLPRVFEQITTNMRLGIRDRLMPPRYLVEKVVTQAQSIADDSEQASPFNQPAFKLPKGISQVDQRRLHDAIVSAVKGEVVPAYVKFANFVHPEYAPKGGTEEARASCAKIRNLMSVLFNHGIRYEICERNPIQLVRQSAKRKAVPVVLSPMEVQRLLSALALRERTLVLLAFGTGLRMSELFALKWRDVNFHTNEVSIVRSIVCSQPMQN
jgi:hypothetical protein